MGFFRVPQPLPKTNPMNEPMNLFEKLRARLATKRSSTAATYWGAVEQIARGAVSERALPALLDKIEGAMITLGKHPEDVEVDASNLKDLHEATAAAAAHDDNIAALKKVRQEGLAIEAEAARLEASASQMRSAHEKAVGQCQMAVSASRAACDREKQAHGRLAASGYEASLARCVSDDRARKIDQAETVLRVAESKLQDFMRERGRRIDKNDALELQSHQELVASRDAAATALAEAKGAQPQA